MQRLAILGSYPEGPETDKYETLAGQWSCWKHGSSSPYKIWADAEPELRATIAKHWAVRIYIYWGQSAPVPTVFEIDDLVIDPKLQPSPGPGFFPDEMAHVWIRYRGGRDLKTKIPGTEFTELVLQNGKLGLSRPIGPASWNNMYRTGLIFVQDPNGK